METNNYRGNSATKEHMMLWVNKRPKLNFGGKLTECAHTHISECVCVCTHEI